MNTFEIIEKINKIFGRNYLSGIPDQQKINRELGKLLVEYRKSLEKNNENNF